jgi:acetoin utilization deacetylase AcuC-like enzyme
MNNNNLNIFYFRIFKQINECYQPEVIVAQCGADSLYGDPIDRSDPFNLTVNGYSKAIKQILDTNIPAIFLGGGLLSCFFRLP